MNCVSAPPIIKTEKPKLACGQRQLSSVQGGDKYWNYGINPQHSTKNVNYIFKTIKSG